jgi:hypothetical protein
VVVPCFHVLLRQLLSGLRKTTENVTIIGLLFEFESSSSRIVWSGMVVAAGMETEDKVESDREGN